MSKPTREEIQQRRAACDASELDEHRKYAAAMERIRRCREYYQAECCHDIIVSQFEISHFIRKCETCGKIIKDEPCNPSS